MHPIRILLLVIFGSLLVLVQAQERMYGGQDVSINEYPFVVAIAYGPDLVGNGAILSPIWIISSAGPFGYPGDENYRAHVGGENFGGGEVYQALRIFRHSEFVNWDYNIALMRVNRKIKFGDTAQPIKITSSDPDSIDVILLSYGTNEQGTKHLRSAAYSLASDNNCVDKMVDILAKELIRSRHGYCMYPAPDSHKGQWQDDAGAPAVINNELYGVFAFSENTGGYTDVSIVTRIAFFKDWIDNVMSKPV